MALRSISVTTIYLALRKRTFTPHINCSLRYKVLKLAPKHLVHTFLIIVDAFSISRFDNALLIVDLYDEPGREFRALPTQIQSIENNLSVANMDFEEFAESVDEDGVFRGF